MDSFMIQIAPAAFAFSLSLLSVSYPFSDPVLFGAAW